MQRFTGRKRLDSSGVDGPGPLETRTLLAAFESQPPLPPPPPHLRSVQVARVVLKDHDVADPKVIKPGGQFHPDLGHIQARTNVSEADDANENDGEAGEVSDSGSEMSLSSVENAPIISLSDNSDNGDKSRTQTNELVYVPDKDLLPSSRLSTIDPPTTQNSSQHNQVSDLLPPTRSDHCDPQSFDPQPVCVNSKDTDQTRRQVMTKPVKPSPLRQSVTSRQIQDKTEAVDALMLTSPSLTDSGPVNENNTKDSHVEPDAYAPPAVSSGTQFQPLPTSTGTPTEDSGTKNQNSYVAAQDIPPTQATNAKAVPDLSSDPFTPVIPPGPTIDRTARERNVHNKGRDGESVVPVNQPVWKQGNLTMRAGIAHTDAETQRRAEIRRDRAYHKSIEAAEPFFNEGAKDHMISGCEVGEIQVRESDNRLWAGDADFEEMVAMKSRIAEEAASEREVSEKHEKSEKIDSIDDLIGHVMRVSEENED